jgi:hypothetical protein
MWSRWYAAKLPQGRVIAALAVEPFQRQRFGEIGAWLAALRTRAMLRDGWTTAGRRLRMTASSKPLWRRRRS